MIKAIGIVAAGTTTYLNGLHFLDSQAAFVGVFGDYPTIFTVSNEDQGVIID